MIVDCVSDLHGHYPKLDGGDLLIVAGDLTASDGVEEYIEFLRWFKSQDYKKKVLIAGNHDNALEGPWPGETVGPFRENKAFYDFNYLCDSGTEFENLKIWGSPWTKRFPGMNSHCMAFTVDTDEELAEKWSLIPDDVDVLITHCPAFGMHDTVYNGDKIINTGSPSLHKWLAGHMGTFKLHVCGHIHESYGRWDFPPTEIETGYYMVNPIFINASHVNERYQPVNKPIRIELDAKGV